jgi:polyhydroxybutyrate depolymerase
MKHPRRRELIMAVALDTENLMLRFMLILIGLLSTQLPALACGPSEPCRIDAEAFYLVSPPPEWDGKKPIGAFVFIHGHRATAAEMIGYRELIDAVHAQGFMLVAPQGLGDSWSTPGSPGDGRRNEVSFIASVMDDLAKRFPVDQKRAVASGFSQGASVVWEIACHGDGRFQAFLPIAGVWWQPMPKECKAPPRPLLHIHGTADPVMPMTGRNLRDRWKQGDVRDAMTTLKKVNGCSASPTRTEPRGPLTCELFSGCLSHKPVALCLHGGDHHTNPRWITDVKEWLAAILL